MSRFGSDERQLRIDTEAIDLDGVDINVLRNIRDGTDPDREGELAVQTSAAGDFAGMVAYLDGQEIPITGGRANVPGIPGEIELTGFEYGAIPDNDIYLHDDWGDNKLTDRDDSGTTTHNGEEGFYRPEWTALSGDSLPSASGERLRIQSGGESMEHDINIDLSETVTWEFSSIDLTNMTVGGFEAVHYTLFAEQISNINEEGFLHRSYQVLLRVTDSPSIDCGLWETDNSGNQTNIITGTQNFSPLPSSLDIKVTRTAAGEWELFEDDVSQGTQSDTSHTDPQKAVISGHADSGNQPDQSLSEMKVF